MKRTDVEARPEFLLRALAHGHMTFFEHGVAELAGVPVAVLVKGLVAWTQLFGLVNFELFGQFQNTIDDPTELADQSLRLMARFLGFTDAD